LLNKALEERHGRTLALASSLPPHMFPSPAPGVAAMQRTCGSRQRVSLSHAWGPLASGAWRLRGRATCCRARAPERRSPDMDGGPGGCMGSTPAGARATDILQQLGVGAAAPDHGVVANGVGWLSRTCSGGSGALCDRSSGWGAMTAQILVHWQHGFMVLGCWFGRVCAASGVEVGPLRLSAYASCLYQVVVAALDRWLQGGFGRSILLSA
jgi:hypothetical protein